MIATSTFDLDQYDETGMSGSFNLSFMDGGYLHGEFEDVVFVEW